MSRHPRGASRRIFHGRSDELRRQLAWLEKERVRLEAEYEAQYDSYFNHLDAKKRHAEREARGETVFP